jgi:hypothetical protein
VTDPPPNARDGDEHPDAVRWNERYRGRREAGDPNSWLLENAKLLPTGGAALDAAGGLGATALWLADRGFSVTLADVSAVALDAAKRAADTCGAELACMEVDLTGEGLPSGPWQVVHLANFLDRALLVGAPAFLAVGGVLVFSQPTTTNLQRNQGPGERFCLSAGETAELARAVAGCAGTTCEVAAEAEGWTEAGTHLGRFVVRRLG